MSSLIKVILLLSCLVVPLGAQVTYTPQPVAFGAVKLGATSRVDTVTLTNTGTASFTFCGPAGCTTATGVSKSHMVGSADFHYVGEDNKCAGTFAVGASCKLWYQYTPTKVGPASASNVVATSVGEFPLNFTGTGVDTVTPPPPPPPPVLKVTSVAVAPITVTVAVGEFTVQLYGFRALSDGRGSATVATLLWSSSDTTVVKVTSGAVIIPVGAGTATITASDSSRTISATSVVTVLPQRQVTVFGLPTWTGASLVPVTDTTGRVTARVLMVVRAP